MQKLRKSSNRTYILIAILIIAINCAAVIGILSAKYIKDYFPVGTLTLSVELDEDVELFEHKAVRQTDGDGSYYLLDNTKVTANKYVVMPGVDIPKDPQFYFKKKSAVPVYLYVEIETTIPDTVEYTLEKEWIKLGTVTGPKDGPVYVYSTDGVNAAIITHEVFPADTTVPILDGNIIVSDTAGSTNPDETFSMNVHGYLAQVIKDGEHNKDAEPTFISNFMSPTP